ncbi:hypothetical protein CA85_03180 [Allorhodopirellula solitaria]|uniref:Uncharacterized protein n=1 Tax=Allorhodopirellula solitaria TaxID=2527987 RepID=A0A5C5YJH4_9BACT|nr:hypothetical protein CA85_03180 [Allorhodopirellula solitaria]
MTNAQSTQVDRLVGSFGQFEQRVGPVPPAVPWVRIDRRAIARLGDICR